MDFKPAFPRRSDLPFSLGWHLPTTEDSMDGRTPGWSDLVAMAQEAERVGLDVLWLSDHVGFEDKDAPDGWKGAWDCWTVMTGLAAVTERLHVGPYVLAIPYRNAALTAKMAETLDEVSGGRLILGLGAGWNEPEFTAYDFPFTDRFDRFEDGLRIISSMLRSGRADLDGNVVSARGALVKPRGPSRTGPPVMVGAFGKRTMRLTAELADGWDAGSGSLQETTETFAKMDAACRAAGRDPASLSRSVEAVVELPGDPEALARSLLAYDTLPIDHLLFTLRPASVEGVRALEPVINAMKAAHAGA
jgi:alkanesulfonate monooxygenase SsuD/methylene tetrahydromethanopterin reductase-like flavin-dependent oxidoreductase (luciferase family)